MRDSELWKIGRVLAAHQFPLQIVRRAPTSFDGQDWLFEIEHDGLRMLAIRDNGPTRLFTRNGYDFTRRNRLIAAALDALPVERFVLDGELVVLDDDGRSNFAVDRELIRAPSRSCKPEALNRNVAEAPRLSQFSSAHRLRSESLAQTLRADPRCEARPHMPS